MTIPAHEVQTWLASQEVLVVVPLADPLVESLGHAPHSTYAETYWLPLLGPSALWAMRRLAALAQAEPAGATLRLAELGPELGLGAGTGRSSPLVRTLARLVLFNMAEIDRHSPALRVRLAVPPLAARHLRRLPEHLAARCAAEAAVRPKQALRKALAPAGR